VLPRPGSDSTQIWPPWPSTISGDVEAEPVPRLEVVLGAHPANFWNSFPSWSADAEPVVGHLEHDVLRAALAHPHTIDPAREY